MGDGDSNANGCPEPRHNHLFQVKKSRLLLFGNSEWVEFVTVVHSWVPPGLPTVCCESKSTLKSTVHCESTVESKSTVVCQLTPTILLNLGLGHHRLFCPPGSFPQNHSSERKVGIFLSKKENGQKLFRSILVFSTFVFWWFAALGGLEVRPLLVCPTSGLIATKSRHSLPFTSTALSRRFHCMPANLCTVGGAQLHSCTLCRGTKGRREVSVAPKKPEPLLTSEVVRKCISTLDPSQSLPYLLQLNL